MWKKPKKATASMEESIVRAEVYLEKYQGSDFNIHDPWKDRKCLCCDLHSTFKLGKVMAPPRNAYL